MLLYVSDYRNMMMVKLIYQISLSLEKVLSIESLPGIQEAISESPLLFEGLECTLFEALVMLFDWLFSSHPSLSKEAFTRDLLLCIPSLLNGIVFTVHTKKYTR